MSSGMEVRVCFPLRVGIPTIRTIPKRACEHCGGVIRHERWCITCDALVRYAYDAVAQPEKLSVADRLILHALGVLWEESCQGACQPV